VAASEFDLIRRYFADATGTRADVALGIGDDCALLDVPAGQSLAVSMDSLVAGRHFDPNDCPEGVGHKALAVNLSDLAAMGAHPAWTLMSLTLPHADEVWVESFMRGFSRLAQAFGVQLVGGDTTRGPLSVTVQVSGFVDAPTALRRSGASPGDRLFVSGTLGDAALALRLRQAGDVPAELAERLDRPMPRVALGRLLRGRAGAAIDISDGLLADLHHVCEASGLGARVELHSLPLSAPVQAMCRTGDWQLPLSGGDDYELLFSVPPTCAAELQQLCTRAQQPVREIGEFVAGQGIVLIHPDGRETEGAAHGFDHFR
jgi:thiamine-monophosphate kinase